jgi:glutamyl-tRNA reductase
MSLVCIGLSHRTAPVEVRERHAFPPARMTEALVALSDYSAVREAAMLSTCNRLEIYAMLTDDDDGIKQLKDFLVSFRHGNVPYDINPYLYTLVGMAAVRHFFRVSTGLDSQMLGEADVLGQVKQAYQQGQLAHSIGASLHRLFREALNAGKAAQSQTAIGNNSISIATAAIEMAKHRVGDLNGKNVLLVGAGRMGETAAKRLKLEGAARLVVVNRTPERARELVARLGIGEVVMLPSIGDELTLADVVITSTGASHFVLRPDNVAEAMRRRDERPLFIVDIAVPRDVDPEVSHIPGVHVADIDALGAIVDGTLERRRKETPLVEKIIAERVAAYEAWYESRAVVPVIASLSQKAETIRDTEIERLFARCPYFSERERTLVTGASLRIISRLLHSAVSRIRERAIDDTEAAAARARILDELFDLHISDAANQATTETLT